MDECVCFDPWLCRENLCATLLNSWTCFRCAQSAYTGVLITLAFLKMMLMAVCSVRYIVKSIQKSICEQRRTLQGFDRWPMSLSLAACRLVESPAEANKLMPCLHLITAAQPTSRSSMTMSALSLLTYTPKKSRPPPSAEGGWRPQ